MTEAARLRDDADALSVLVNRVAELHGLNPAFLEKDFWAMEVLRVVMQPRTIMSEGRDVTIQVIFKGGTSLSRVYRLVDRFSEDIDVLVAFPEDAGRAARERFLRSVVSDVQKSLGVELQNAEGSREGVALNKRFLYPSGSASDVITDGVLLEMGSRGGPFPVERHRLRSILADAAIDQFGDDESTWVEWKPFEVNVLGAERTLLEKLALLHDIASRFPGSSDKLSKAGRHFYDVHSCLADPAVRARLESLTQEGVGELCGDIDERSRQAGWSFTPRPPGGFSESAIFGREWAGAGQARKSYEVAVRDLVFTEAPSFETCLNTVSRYSHLI